MSELVKIEGNKLYIDHVHKADNNTLPYEGFATLKSKRLLTLKEENCLNNGYFYSAYENNYLRIICRTNDGKVFYIE